MQAAYAPNIWPSGHGELRTAMRAVYEDFTRLSKCLLRIFACALREEESFFEGKVDAHTSNLQVANYSSLVVLPEPVLRKRAHIDSGLLTVLASDGWAVGKAPAVRPPACTEHLQLALAS